VTVPISIDTYKPEVARAAIAAGASLVNYVAMGSTPAMTKVVKDLAVPLIIMHIRGTPEVMHQLAPLPDPCAHVATELAQLRDSALQAGVPAGHVWLDPGFGFGKNGDENYELLAGLSRFDSLGCPLVVGTSRKSFIGKTLGTSADGRLWGTAATVTAAILGGAHVVRVHDVAAMVQVARVADQILAYSPHAKMTSGESG
jgi:dihydropteroate synthase